ncbi:hypothetical protein AMTRI_Chr08g206340 [Amborella trichopoda]
MEDSFNSRKNKRERPLTPQNDEPTMTSCSGSQENLETIPGSLSGLEEKEGHVRCFCSASEEKHEAMKVQKRVKPISVDPLKSKEIEASLSAMESELEFKRNRDCSNEEKDSKPFVSLSNPEKKPESMEPSHCSFGKSTRPEMVLLLSGVAGSLLISRGRKASSTKFGEEGGGGEEEGLGSYEGRPRRRLTSFSITNSMDEMVIIDHSTLESLFISIVLCFKDPQQESYNFSAGLLKLTVDPEMEFGELLPSLVSAMLEDSPTVKPHIDFVADQFVVLDQEFSKFKAIKKYMRLFKEDMEKIKMLRQENMVNRRKFSGPSHSIHECNAKFDKKASKVKDGEKVIMEKPRPPKKPSLPTDIENREKNIETFKKVAMDTRKLEGIEVVDDELVAFSMAGTIDIENTWAQRSLKGFDMLDDGETVQPFKNLEYSRLYILEIQPSYNSNKPDLGVRCKSFGPAITCYFKLSYVKAMLCIRACHIISASPDLEFDEFCRELVSDTLRRFDTFKDEETTRNYVNSHLGFRTEQLIGLDGISFFDRPLIKSITEKFNVVKALDRKECGSFLSLYDKNWWIKICQSEDTTLAETTKKREIKVPQGQSSEPSNSKVSF